MSRKNRLLSFVLILAPLAPAAHGRESTERQMPTFIRPGDVQSALDRVPTDRLGALSPSLRLRIESARHMATLASETREAVALAPAAEPASAKGGGGGGLKKNALPASIVSMQDFENDGIFDFSSVQYNTWDDQRDLVQVIFEADELADGTINYRELVDLTYDSWHNVVFQLGDVDADGDGVVDFIYSYNIINTYSKKGIILTQVFEFDDGRDGIIEFRGSYEATYDRKQNILEVQSQTDFDGDGTFDDLFIQTYNY